MMLSGSRRGEDVSGEDGDEAVLDDDLWLLLLFFKICCVWGCLLLKLRKTRSEDWLFGLPEILELMGIGDTILGGVDADDEFVTLFGLYDGDCGRDRHKFCCKNWKKKHYIMVIGDTILDIIVNLFIM